MPAGQFFWANGAPAPDVTLSFGLTTNDAGGDTPITWGALPGRGYGDGATGVYNTFLMKGWFYSINNNDLAVRVSGLPQGVYQVFTLARSHNDTTRTFDVYTGTNLVNSADSAADKQSIDATTATAWTEGENYVTSIVRVNSEDDYITVIVDPTSEHWAVLHGLQIVNITHEYYQGTIILVE